MGLHYRRVRQELHAEDRVGEAHHDSWGRRDQVEQRRTGEACAPDTCRKWLPCSPRCGAPWGFDAGPERVHDPGGPSGRLAFRSRPFGRGAFRYHRRERIPCAAERQNRRPGDQTCGGAGPSDSAGPDPHPVAERDHGLDELERAAADAAQPARGAVRRPGRLPGLQPPDAPPAPVADAGAEHAGCPGRQPGLSASQPGGADEPAPAGSPPAAAADLLGGRGRVGRLRGVPALAVDVPAVGPRRAAAEEEEEAPDRPAPGRDRGRAQGAGGGRQDRQAAEGAAGQAARVARQGLVAATGRREKEGQLQAAAAQEDVSKPIAPDSPDYEKLQTPEIEVCAILRITPTQYLSARDFIVSRTERVGFLRKKEVKTNLRMDVNKAGKLYDWMAAIGWIPTPAPGAREPLVWDEGSDVPVAFSESLTYGRGTAQASTDAGDDDRSGDEVGSEQDGEGEDEEMEAHGSEAGAGEHEAEQGVEEAAGHYEDEGEQDPDAYYDRED
ncbi:hypothetical protein DFJ74DRAFT_343185 [Hyaloraphidium curvatum]|nr:hypothetical protein DFJ74DRAFT_343185 [Hyaloraphidium curvatum]